MTKLSHFSLFAEENWKTFSVEFNSLLFEGSKYVPDDDGDVDTTLDFTSLTSITVIGGFPTRIFLL